MQVNLNNFRPILLGICFITQYNSSLFNAPFTQNKCVDVTSSASPLFHNLSATKRLIPVLAGLQNRIFDIKPNLSVRCLRWYSAIMAPHDYNERQALGIAYSSYRIVFTIFIHSFIHLFVCLFVCLLFAWCVLNALSNSCAFLV